MELVPPNSEKITKYTGSAQYIENGRVSFHYGLHVIYFNVHNTIQYAGERLLQYRSLKWSTTNSNFLWRIQHIQR